jgi:hypothetical protein
VYAHIPAYGESLEDGEPDYDKTRESYRSWYPPDCPSDRKTTGTFALSGICSADGLGCGVDTKMYRVLRIGIRGGLKCPGRVRYRTSEILSVAYQEPGYSCSVTSLQHVLGYLPTRGNSTLKPRLRNLQIHE